MIYQVLRCGRLQKQSHDQIEVNQVFEEQCKNYPRQPVCLIKVDILQTNPVQQEINEKIGLTQ